MTIEEWTQTTGRRRFSLDDTAEQRKILESRMEAELRSQQTLAALDSKIQALGLQPSTPRKTPEEKELLPARAAGEPAPRRMSLPISKHVQVLARLKPLYLASTPIMEPKYPKTKLQRFRASATVPVFVARTRREQSVRSRTRRILQQRWMDTGLLSLCASANMFMKAVAIRRQCKRERWAAYTIQKCWKSHNLYHRRMKRVSRTITRNANRLMAKIYRQRQQRSAKILRIFLSQHMRFDRVTRVIKRLRWRIIKVQRAFRAFLVCRDARLKLLDQIWVKQEKEHANYFLSRMDAAKNLKYPKMTSEHLKWKNKVAKELAESHQKLVKLFRQSEQNAKALRKRRKSSVKALPEKSKDIRLPVLEAMLKRKRAMYMAKRHSSLKSTRQRYCPPAVSYTMADIVTMVRHQKPLLFLQIQQPSDLKTDEWQQIIFTTLRSAYQIPPEN